ncbi:class I SAM-dependent methyltransferase [Sneathiella sp.]|uniref:class I SAM-dependent methyltransferase n=1 Tax=Sneathiella sp. TaxID=1964365 RepID=UPI003566A12C
MKVLPPGTLLQLMYLKERLNRIPSGKFIEIGPGSGEITRLLLDSGWSGYSYDLDGKTITALKERFSQEITENRLAPTNADFVLSPPPSEKVDLVISCMVMEHLEEETQTAYMRTAAECLKNNGIMIALVPSSPAHWGIEDDIAGHCRRYTRASVTALTESSGYILRHAAGLTFPVSNLLLPISNFLVNRSERSKLKLSALDRTKLSGRRQVMFKTYFPVLLGVVLNKYALFPLHIIQKLFSNSERSLVLYFEAQPGHFTQKK